jgi:hypothetical protein
MEGTVEVSRSTGNAVPMIVNEGLAVRADARTRSRLRVIEYAGENFALRVAEPQRDALRYIHFGFDESGGPEIEDSGYGFEGGPFDATLFPGEEPFPKPRRTPGQVGGCLRFLPGEALMTPGPVGLAASEPHTISFWIKIPPRAALNPEAAAFSIGTDGSGELDGWRVAWNAEPAAGTVGALRIDGGEGGFLVGATDLRDGRWHHVTSQFIGGEGASVSTHVHLYIDGALEGLSSARDGRLPSGKMTRLSMGADAAGDFAGFEGWIDEFHLFKGTISPLVIQRLANGEKLR